MNESNQGRSLREITRILFQHWVLMAVVVATATIGTWSYCQFVAKKTYRSRIGLIFKRPADRNPLTTDQGERQLEVFVKAQQQIITSDLVLARAMVIAEDKTLRDEWYELRTQRDRERAGYAEQTNVEHDIDAFLTEGPVAERVESLLTQRQREFKDFRDSVELETPGGEQVAMTETFTLLVDRPGGNGAIARYSADILADMYMHRFREIQETMSAPAVEVMKNVIDDYRRQVAQAKNGYDEFINENASEIGVLEQLMKSGSEHGVQRWLSKIRENDADLRMKWAQSKAVYEVLMDVMPATVFETGGIESMPFEDVRSTIARVPVEFLEENVAIVEVTKHLSKLEARKANLDSQFHESSRELQYLKEELDTESRNLLMAIASQAQSLGSTVAALQRQIDENQKLIASTTREEEATHRKLAQYARLKTAFDAAQEHLGRLERDEQEARANQFRAQHAVTIGKLSDASTPDPMHPLRPKTALYTLAAFFASFMLSIAMAFFLDHFDHTLHSSLDAERYLGVPVLGSVKKHGRFLVEAGMN
ncbi:MAG: hypothetical protein H6818_18120 [Phycisphaerales bacterium]|nr:hypothetical protein [Phycisphaerales bacterium]